MAFIPREYQKGIHTVDFLIWQILVQTIYKTLHTHVPQGYSVLRVYRY